MTQNVDPSAPGKFGEWKTQVIRYYDKVLSRLILDVRVFAVTNVIAAAAAWWFAYQSQEKIYAHLLIASGILFLAIILCVMQFIDDFTFFRIITNSTTITSYPLTMIGLFAWLYHDLSPAFRRVVEIDKAIESGR